MLPELPQDIVRKIFAYNIQRYADQYDINIARLYNVIPEPLGTWQFLRPFSDEFRVLGIIYETYGYCPDEIREEIFGPGIFESD